jgi:hypothetical protein
MLIDREHQPYRFWSGSGPRISAPHNPASIRFKDTKNRIRRVNQRIADAVGLSVEAIEGTSAAEIYPDQRIPPIMAMSAQRSCWLVFVTGVGLGAYGAYLAVLACGRRMPA